jgi:hypothetical protein
MEMRQQVIYNCQLHSEYGRMILTPILNDWETEMSVNHDKIH